MLLVFVVLFVVAPALELFVIVQVSGSLGVPETILLLVTISVVGVWLAKLAGISVIARMQAAVRRGQVPSAQIVDGALVLGAAILLIVPGFISDVLAILLLLPPTRTGVRTIVLRKIREGGGFASVIVGRAPGGGQRAGEVWDVEGWEDPPERPGLAR